MTDLAQYLRKVPFPTWRRVARLPLLVRRLPVQA